MSDESRHQLLKFEEGVLQGPFTDAVIHDQDPRKNLKGWRWVLVASSCLINLVLVYLLASTSADQGPKPSTFAHLLPELSLPWIHKTEYGTENVTESEVLWNGIEFDTGIVALDREYTRSKGIPDAQPFPWDPSKGLYVLNGYHSLHCLKAIHQSIIEYKLEKKQTYPFEHVMHCMDNLRQEVHCQADDIPRWTSNNNRPENGIGQHRQCRDWSKLERWAKEHTACYRRLNESANAINQLERFKFCPADSPYLPKVREYFGVAEDWLPQY